jgi:hypothetical protein
MEPAPSNRDCYPKPGLVHQREGESRSTAGHGGRHGERSKPPNRPPSVSERAAIGCVPSAARGPWLGGGRYLQGRPEPANTGHSPRPRAPGACRFAPCACTGQSGQNRTSRSSALRLPQPGGRQPSGRWTPDRRGSSPRSISASHPAADHPSARERVAAPFVQFRGRYGPPPEAIAIHSGPGHSRRRRSSQ